MFDEFLIGPGYSTLAGYLQSPSTRLAVLMPGILSLGIVVFYSRSGRISERLQLLWVLALPISFCCARWDDNGDMQQLYIYSAFSVVCLILLFKRVYISPPLAYALTFLSLWWVDVTHAFCQFLEYGGRLDQFYLGVGGAGMLDSLFLVPLFTALVVGYAKARLEHQGATLAMI